jgi:prevent-host-death family protein
MRMVEIHEAKAKMSRLVEQAARGEPFIIAKAGKPMVKVIAVGSSTQPRRVGFMEGEIEVPDDFDRMGDTDIAAMFGVDP